MGRRCDHQMSHTHTARKGVHARTPRDWWSSINWSPINVLTSRQFYCIIHCSEGDGDGDGGGGGLCVWLCVCSKDPPRNTILRKKNNGGVKEHDVFGVRNTPQKIMENTVQMSVGTRSNFLGSKKFQIFTKPLF